MREFALGELGWTLDRYRKSSVYEWNQAVKGYWRNWERQTAWMAREISWTIIQWAPFYKNEDKPKRITDLMKLSIDHEEKIVKEKIKKPTQKEIDLYQKIQFSLKKDGSA